MRLQRLLKGGKEMNLMAYGTLTRHCHSHVLPTFDYASVEGAGVKRGAVACSMAGGSCIQGSGQHVEPLKERFTDLGMLTQASYN